MPGRFQDGRKNEPDMKKNKNHCADYYGADEFNRENDTPAGENYDEKYDRFELNPDNVVPFKTELIVFDIYC